MSAPASLPPGTQIEHELSWRQEYLWRIHASISENIRFADAKAGFTVAIAGAVLGALFTLNQSPGHGLRVAWGWAQWCCILAYALLMLSAIAGSWCVRPRLRGSPGKGLVFWRNIAGYPSHAEFARAFITQEEVALDEHLAESIHDLSLICEEKYRFLRVALSTGIVGGLLGALALFRMSLL
jgi:hypothetical protein